MKKSYYNFFYKLDDGNYLAFNALKNGLAVLDEEIVKQVEALDKETQLSLDDDFITELKKGGFVVADDFNEYELLTTRRHMQQYHGNSLGLTIAPTLNCNLSCKYCYENPGNTFMNKKTQEGLIAFVKSYIEGGTKSLSVTWYGGEPLLCTGVIENLSKKFISLCKKKKVNYSAGIITNGTLFDRQTAGKLKDLNVGFAQVTIDGDRDTHDQRRPYTSGKGSFDHIMKNVRDVAGILPLSLRVNIDNSNADNARDFIKSFQTEELFKTNLEKGLINIHFGHVRKYTTSCRCSHEESLEKADFWAKDMEIKRFCYNNIKGFDYYPNINAGCTATSIDSYVVGPGGELYKCWNHLGIKDMAVGTVFEPVELDSLYISYLSDSFEKDEECKKCKFLPICMGGCVDIRVKSRSGEFPGKGKDCSQWKYYLEESLKLFYLSKINDTIQTGTATN